MKKREFAKVEQHMRRGMQNSVHDVGHIYRVLYAALRIAKTEPKADMDVVILAALLHDIGRLAAEKTPGAGHAQLGAGMAYKILQKEGFSREICAHVRDCIDTHSYKAQKPPKTLEAKILFDADKLDLCGAVGTARALLFGAEIGEPLYLTGKDGLPTPGKKTEKPSLYREYNRKLKHLPEKFFTKKGRKMAQKRQKAMDAWFAALRSEVDTGYRKGVALLNEALQ